MNKPEFIQVPRSLLLTSIKDIRSSSAHLPEDEMNNWNGRTFVAHLSGLLKESDPEVSEALFELVRLG